MSILATIISAALPVFLVLGSGYLARERGWLSAEADASLMKLIINVFYPCLTLTFILGNPALRDAAEIGCGLGLGAFITILGMSLGYLVAPFGGMQIGSGRRTFAFVTGLNNYGYIAIPVAAAVFGINSPMMGVLLVCNVGIEVMLWTFGLLILRGEVDRNVWKKLLSPPLVAMLIGLTLNYTGLPEAKGAAGQGYAVLKTALTMLGACAVPIGLAVSGASFRDLVKSGEWLGRWQVPTLGISLRNGLLPAFYILMALSIPFPTELKQVLIIHAAMPAAMLPIVLARFYGGSPAVAVQVVVASTIAGMITIPIWLWAGLSLLH